MTNFSTRYSRVWTRFYCVFCQIQIGLFGSRKEGRGRLDIPDDETGVSPDFVEADGKVVWVRVTECEGVTRPGVAYWKRDHWTA